MEREERVNKKGKVAMFINYSGLGCCLFGDFLL
jgi:hypothetical protein